MPRILYALVCLCYTAPAIFAQDFIPRRQDKPPGPPLSPQAAIDKMTVPEGFTVELVAAEPDVVNPVGMAIDERGRFWVTESFEYPRREPGPGRDRVKILEDTNGDGQVDKVTVFAEGLNIPSGIAVGHGGVWVANAPDILFMQDTDGDGKADKVETIVTGFGRTDTHELPNSLTWGPDGWLYGLNGVFNYCDVKYAKENPNYDAKHPGWKFTCALFRIHPRTREFQLFAEGTSNPWGVAWNDNGEPFLSACVIDHLWHLTETGYYHRQGGPYPPHTWKIESIVKHTHQLAAYCGIHYYDADAYPDAFRGKLYMGNIHGGCINIDALRRDGSTYFGTPEPDFLTANDVWFMPVVQKTGPDGCLYILDWYDRYHCYQDANADPAGIDRGHGRLYRVRYKDTPHTPAGFDLGSESDERLIERLHQHNDFIRWTAQRLLAERSNPDTRAQLEQLALNNEADRQTRLFALWTVQSMHREPGRELDGGFVKALRNDRDPTLRAWGVRFGGNDSLDAWKAGSVAESAERQVYELVDWAVGDESPDVRLQGLILAGRHARTVKPSVNYGELIAKAVITAQDDKLLPRIAWANLLSVLDRHAHEAVGFATTPKIADGPGGREIVPRLVQWMLAQDAFDAPAIAKVIEFHAAQPGGNPDVAGACLAILADGVQNKTLAGEKLRAIKLAISPLMQTVLRRDSKAAPYYWTAMLAASWNDPLGLQAVRAMLTDARSAQHDRVAAMTALISAGEEELLLKTVDEILTDDKTPVAFRGTILATLGRLNAPLVADVVLGHFAKLEPELKPQAIELLTQRKAWSMKLLAAIGEKTLDANALNLNQVRRMLAGGDPEIAELVAKHWGTVREGRSPQRDKVMAEMKQLIRSKEGDPFAGENIYMRVCGQCHKMHGQGQEVGPDITLNGRSSFEQLLSNVFDPSLVIGASYQSHTVVTDEGRILNGLLVEDTPERITLKVQGGKLETIPKAAIEISKKSELSLMPEELEKQINAEEMIDLFAYITLDKHPSDPNARRLAGSRRIEPRETSNAEEYAEIIGEVAPGFSTTASGVAGVALEAEHMERSAVVRTHPLEPNRPCVLTGQFAIPSDRKTWLLLDVAHHAEGNWRVQVKVDGTQILSEDVGGENSKGWREFKLDLSKWAGKTVKIELENHATGWHYEFGYWGRAVVASE